MQVCSILAQSFHISVLNGEISRAASQYLAKKLVAQSRVIGHPK